MDRITKVLNEALASLVALNKGMMRRDQAVENLRDLAEHLEAGGYAPDLTYDRKKDTFMVGRE